MTSHHVARLFVASVTAVTAVGIMFAQCQNPPTTSGNSWRRGTVVTYQFIGSWDYQSCVVDALDKWSAANQSTSAISYVPVQSGQTPMLTLNRVSLGGNYAGNTTGKTRDSQGYLIGVGIQFTTDTSLLDSCEGFLKVALHELGHVHSLDETSAANGSSVMNPMSGKNDEGGNIPTDVTSCDKDMAFSKSPIPPFKRDDDNDGWSPDDDYPDTDCDDTNADIHPGDVPSCDFVYQWGYIDANCDGIHDGNQCVSPIIVDLAGDGFRLTNAHDGVMFDLDNDGAQEQVSWTVGGSDDAWLVLDRNGNGTIDGGDELFGNFSPQPPSNDPNGFLALAVFDDPDAGGNGDGWIDKDDAVFSQLRLWRDRNHDGVSQPNELLALPDAGLRRISTDYRESKKTDQWGNWFRYRSKVRDKKDRDIGQWAYDVYLTALSPYQPRVR